jgi:hypothetical protein
VISKGGHQNFPLLIICTTWLAVDGMVQYNGCQFLVNRVFLDHKVLDIPSFTVLESLCHSTSKPYSLLTISDVKDQNSQHMIMTLVISCNFTAGQALGWSQSLEVGIVEARNKWH